MISKSRSGKKLIVQIFCLRKTKLPQFSFFQVRSYHLLVETFYERCPNCNTEPTNSTNTTLKMEQFKHKNSGEKFWRQFCGAPQHSFSRLTAKTSRHGWKFFLPPKHNKIRRGLSNNRSGCKPPAQNNLPDISIPVNEKQSNFLLPGILIYATKHGLEFFVRRKNYFPMEHSKRKRSLLLKCVRFSEKLVTMSEKFRFCMLVSLHALRFSRNSGTWPFVSLRKENFCVAIFTSKRNANCVQY